VSTGGEYRGLVERLEGCARPGHEAAINPFDLGEDDDRGVVVDVCAVLCEGMTSSNGSVRSARTGSGAARAA